MIFDIGKSRCYTWKYSLFWREVYEALYDSVAGMSMLTLNKSRAAKTNRSGQKLCFFFFLFFVFKYLFFKFHLFWWYHYQMIV